jgi:general secretion pathway protein H
MIRTVPRRQSSQGFTLLELLVVLTIMGLLLAAVPGGLFAHIPSMRLHKDALDIVSLLRSARNDALADGVEQDVVFDVKSEHYWRRADRPLLSLPQGTTLELQSFPASQLQSSIGRVRFLADGSSSGGDIVLRRGAKSFVIDIDWLSGNVTLRG